MSGGALLRTTLTAGSPAPTSAEDRVRPNMVDSDDAYDYIAFIRSTVNREMGLDNTVLAISETFNIFCWSETVEGAQALEAQVVPLLTAAGFSILPNEADGADAVAAGNCVVLTCAYITTPEFD